MKSLKKTLGYRTKLEEINIQMKISKYLNNLTSNLLVNMIQFIVALSMRVFAVISKEVLPK